MPLHTRDVALAIVGLVTMAGCATTSAPPSTEVPTDLSPESAAGAHSVYRKARFEVETTSDVVYGQVLSHTAWGTSENEAIARTLNVYKPVDPQGWIPIGVVEDRAIRQSSGVQRQSRLSGVLDQLPTR